MVEFVESLLAGDALGEALGDEGGHLPGSFESEEIGLVLNGHDLLIFVLVDLVVRVPAVLIIAEVAVELSAEEVRHQFGNDGLFLGILAVLADGFVLGDKDVSVFRLEYGHEVPEGG